MSPILGFVVGMEVQEVDENEDLLGIPRTQESLQTQSKIALSDLCKLLGISALRKLKKEELYVR